MTSTIIPQLENMSIRDLETILQILFYNASEFFEKDIKNKIEKNQYLNEFKMFLHHINYDSDGSNIDKIVELFQNKPDQIDWNKIRELVNKQYLEKIAGKDKSDFRSAMFQSSIADLIRTLI